MTSQRQRGQVYIRERVNQLKADGWSVLDQESLTIGGFAPGGKRWYRKKDCLSAWDLVAWRRITNPETLGHGYVRGYWQFGRRSERNEKLKELRAWVEVHGLQGEVFFLELLHLPGNEIQNHKRVNVERRYWETIGVKKER